MNHEENSMNDQGFTEEELLANIEFNANKLLFLIQNSTMPDDVKESFIDLLPQFSLEQIERLIDILEAKYLDEKTKDIDEKLKTDLQKVVDEFEIQDEKDRENLTKQLNLISQNI